MEFGLVKPTHKMKNNNQTTFRSSLYGPKSERSSFMKPWEVEDFSYEDISNRSGAKILVASRGKTERKSLSPSESITKIDVVPESLSGLKVFKKVMEITATPKSKNFSKKQNAVFSIQQPEQNPSEELNAVSVSLGKSLVKSKDEKLKTLLVINHIRETKTLTSSPQNQNKSKEPIEMISSKRLSEAALANPLLDDLKVYLKNKDDSRVIEPKLKKSGLLSKNEVSKVSITQEKLNNPSVKFTLKNITCDDNQDKKEQISHVSNNRNKIVSISLPINEVKELKRYGSVQKDLFRPTDYATESIDLQKIKMPASIKSIKTETNNLKARGDYAYGFRSLNRDESIFQLSDQDGLNKSLKDKDRYTPSLEAVKSQSISIKPHTLAGNPSSFVNFQNATREDFRKTDQLSVKPVDKIHQIVLKINPKKNPSKIAKGGRSPSKGSFTLMYKRGKRIRNVLENKTSGYSNSISHTTDQVSLPGIDTSKKDVQFYFEKVIKEKDKPNDGITLDIDTKVFKEVDISTRVKQTPLLKLIQKQMDNPEKIESPRKKAIVSLSQSPKLVNIRNAEKNSFTSEDNKYSPRPFNFKNIVANEDNLTGKKYKPLFHLPSKSTVLTLMKSNPKLKESQSSKHNIQLIIQ